LSDRPEYSQEQIDLLRSARLGVELQEAKNSLFYRWLVECAKVAALEAASSFATVDPTDWKAVAAVQADVKRLNDLVGWVDATIQKGLQAETAFDSGAGEDDQRQHHDQGDVS
jgi:hypothetical protein